MWWIFVYLQMVLSYGDLSKTSNVCVSMIPFFEISAEYECNTTGQIAYHHGLTVLSLALTNDSNTTNLRFSLKDENSIEFHVSDVAVGLYRLIIITKDSNSETYCGYNKTIHIKCGQEPGPESDIEPPQPFITFIVFGIICCVAIAAIFCTASFVIQAVVARRRNADRKRKVEEYVALRRISRLSNMHEERIPLTIQHTATVEQNGATGCNGTNEVGKPRVVSGILRNRIPSVKASTSILFLPIPFDKFTRDVMTLLRKILTVDGESNSQCVFDTDEAIKYNRDKFEWMDSITADSHKVSIFLCFTSLDGESRDRNIVDDLMEHFKKIKKPQCHVIFAQLTDCNTNLSDLYPGYSVNVMHDDGFKDLIMMVLKHCGYIFEDKNDVNNILETKESKEFINLINHRKDRKDGSRSAKIPSK